MVHNCYKMLHSELFGLPRKNDLCCTWKIGVVTIKMRPHSKLLIWMRKKCLRTMELFRYICERSTFFSWHPQFFCHFTCRSELFVHHLARYFFGNKFHSIPQIHRLRTILYCLRVSFVCTLSCFQRSKYQIFHLLQQQTSFWFSFATKWLSSNQGSFLFLSCFVHLRRFRLNAYTTCRITLSN